MLPSVLSQQIIQGLEDFLLTGFDSSTRHFQGMLGRFLRDPGNLYKGPYLSVQLPFRRARAGADLFPQVPLPYTPYWHQQLAFQRLRSGEGRSTIVATGTGSGKTECFLYPILDHCLRERGRKGIKAILIYPMNALATDQAKRLAETIWRNPNLKHRVTAGLYVGQNEHSPYKTMGESHLITDKDALRQSPPDILLTNYKMLDYLLIRPRDRKLWRCNEPGDLRYLVVDELHTFDGAQGTDLACLIRRLKARLDCPKGQLICVGTSATIGHDDSRDALIHYARQIFDEPFDGDSVIGETCQSTDEFLGNRLIKYQLLPTDELTAIVDHERYDSVEDYLRAQYRLFFQAGIEGDFAGNGWRVQLGERLKQHAMFINLLRVLERQPVALGDVVDMLRDALPVRSDRLVGQLVNSLCALVSTARVWREEDAEARSRREAEGRPRPMLPFLHVRLQLWVRELRRMVAAVSRLPEDVELRFADDLKVEEGRKHLPLVQCRECHATAWGGVKAPERSEVNADLRTFYNHFFGRHSDVLLMFPILDTQLPAHVNGHPARLCGNCGHYSARADQDGLCPACGSGNVVAVFVPDLRREVECNGTRIVILSKDCPACGARDAMIVFGARSTSLLSVAIGQSYATPFNDDKKLIAFSDSVQDAAHRAGFFAARTWQTNVRTAIALWCDKVLGDRHLLAVSAYAGDIYRTVLAELVKTGLLLSFEVRGERVWALAPAMLRVTSDAAEVLCEETQARLTVPMCDLDLWTGMPCLDVQSAGSYAPTAPRPSYFAKLYRHGEIHRVVAEEHTGLLTRERREQVEQAFIDGTHPWDPNLLSATPTLEMGIDIGGLSSVFLYSVPPAQANYLQRIGRAGRRDGNALTLTVAAGHPHDLYFYADPQLMLRGRVEAPGVFLNASAVLERQFTAFCLDAWVASGVEDDAIPQHIKPVIDHVQAAKLGAFPYTFLDFVRTCGHELLERFKALFATGLTEDSAQFLERFLLGNPADGMGLEWRIVHRLLELAKGAPKPPVQHPVPKAAYRGVEGQTRGRGDSR